MEETVALVDADTKDVLVAGAYPFGDIESGSSDTRTHAPVAIKDALAAEHTTDHAAATDLSSTVPRWSKIDRLDTKEAEKRNLIVLSLLLAAVTVAVLWGSRAQPLLVVWLLSFMLCFVSSMWIIFLVETMGLRIFLYNSYGILLAICVHAALSPWIGALILNFNTHLAACLLGYALADHRQHEGTERSADLVPTTPKEEEFTLLLLKFLAGLMASVPVLAILAGLAWLVWHAGDYRIEELIPMIFFLLSVASVLGIFFVAVMQLRGSLIISPLGFVLTSAYVVAIFVFHLCSSMLLGDVAAMVITWVACLALTGFLGYSMSKFTVCH